MGDSLGDKNNARSHQVHTIEISVTGFFCCFFVQNSLFILKRLLAYASLQTPPQPRGITILEIQCGLANWNDAELSLLTGQTVGKVEKVFPTVIWQAPRLQITLTNIAPFSYLHLNHSELAQERSMCMDVKVTWYF